jgi:hypothetical protein
MILPEPGLSLNGNRAAGTATEHERAPVPVYPALPCGEPRESVTLGDMYCHIMRRRMPQAMLER